MSALERTDPVMIEKQAIEIVEIIMRDSIEKVVDCQIEHVKPKMTPPPPVDSVKETPTRSVSRSSAEKEEKTNAAAAEVDRCGDRMEASRSQLEMDMTVEKTDETTEAPMETVMIASAPEQAEKTTQESITLPPSESSIEGLAEKTNASIPLSKMEETRASVMTRTTEAPESSPLTTAATQNDETKKTTVTEPNANPTLDTIDSVANDLGVTAEKGEASASSDPTTSDGTETFDSKPKSQASSDSDSKKEETRQIGVTTGNSEEEEGTQSPTTDNTEAFDSRQVPNSGVPTGGSEEEEADASASSDPTESPVHTSKSTHDDSRPKLQVISDSDGGSDKEASETQPRKPIASSDPTTKSAVSNSEKTRASDDLRLKLQTMARYWGQKKEDATQNDVVITGNEEEASASSDPTTITTSTVNNSENIQVKKPRTPLVDQTNRIRAKDTEQQQQQQGHKATTCPLENPVEFDRLEDARRHIKVLEDELLQYQRTEYALSASVQRLYDRLDAKEQQRLMDLKSLKTKLGDMNRQLVDKAQQKIQRHQDACRLLNERNERLKQDVADLNDKYAAQSSLVATKTAAIEQLEQQLAHLECQHAQQQAQQAAHCAALEKELEDAKSRLGRSEALDEKQMQWHAEKSLLELKVRTITNKNEALEKQVEELQNIANDAVAMVEKAHSMNSTS